MDESMNFGGSGFWIFALLILVFGINGGLGGNQRTPGNPATQSDVVYTSAFNQLQDENTAIRSDIQRVGYENMAVVKDAAYNNLSEIRDVQAAVNLGFANAQKCCCDTLRAIDGVNYNGALNTASINANTTAQTQKILDALAQNKIESLQAQVNNLQLQNAMAGVVKYPATMTYANMNNPFCGCGGCGCGGTNI